MNRLILAFLVLACAPGCSANSPWLEGHLAATLFARSAPAPDGFRRAVLLLDPWTAQPVAIAATPSTQFPPVAP